jgi:NAD(P)-dependent dehydrogenase (short-subunit alcohol dehydrogenase family)
MRILVIGGTGTIGSAVVARLSGQHNVMVGCRTSAAAAIDITDTASIRRLFEEEAPFDAVVCAAGDAVFKPIEDLTDDDHAFGLRSKLMGQVNVVRVGQCHVRNGGSFTLTSGKLGRRPMPGTTSYSVVNSGIEAFVRAASLELPRGLRINAVSPEWATTTLAAVGMDPAGGVPSSLIAEGYAVAVEGAMTGTVIDAGWRYDSSADFVAIDRPLVSTSA